MYLLEKVWKYNKYICAILALDSGHRCGYVGVNKDSKLFGIDCIKDIKDKFKIDKKEVSLDLLINVHGGITYTEMNRNFFPIYTEEETWFFGFDCAHLGDAQDPKLIDTFRKQYYKNNSIFQDYPEDKIRTLDYCIDECNFMAKQFEQLERKFK